MRIANRFRVRPWACLVPWAAACAQAFAAGTAPSGPADDPSASPLRLELIHSLGANSQRSQRLLFSPDGQRVARLSKEGLELWQIQPARPLMQLARQPVPTGGKTSQTGWRTHETMVFDAAGRLHYLSHANHLWVNPDLTQGASESDVRMISPDGRYALRYGTVGDKPGQSPPQYSGAADDIYDLQQQRSVCQLPGTAAASPGSFGGQWFAAQLRALGPSIPRPLAGC